MASKAPAILVALKAVMARTSGPWDSKGETTGPGG
jgi:hypothetical protein